MTSDSPSETSSTSRVPALGIGTFGSDKYGPPEIAAAVDAALTMGYRFVDCAEVYGNEAEVGEAIRKHADRTMPRAELFVSSKVWNDHHAPQDVRAACERSLQNLGLNYLDAYFVHWPFPNTHAQGAAGDERDSDARPYVHEAFMETWAAMESLVDDGLVRSIGTSNVTVPKLQRILTDARIRPALNQMELHPHFQQPELFELCRREGIVPVGYSPLGSPSRPARDRTPDDLVDLEADVVRQIADERRLTPAQVCIAWAVTRGQVPIPFSVKPEQCRQSLEAAAVRLSPDEMQRMAGLDRNNRLVKGQVFLWDGADSWHDLWDEDGTIAGASPSS